MQHRSPLTCDRSTRTVALVLALLACLVIGTGHGAPAQQELEELSPEARELYEAVRNWRTDEVRALLERGAPIAPLTVFTAAMGRSSRSLPILEMLIAAGAPLDVGVGAEVQGSRMTPLWAAASSGKTEVVAALLRGGADPNLGWAGQTPLAAAAGRGHEEVVRMLIAAGARLDDAGLMGQTPLHGAVVDEDLASVEALLAAGSDPGVRDDMGMTALHWAAQRGNAELVGMLLGAGADVDARSGSGGTPLMAAASSGRGEVVELLLRQGAEVDARDDQGRHAISFAGGVDEVSGPLYAASPELHGFRQAPGIRDAGSYPAGLYSAPCEHSGAPGAVVECKQGGTEVNVQTTVRSNISHGAVKPPECEPIELAAPGEYTFTVFRSVSEWSADSCYELRETDGTVRTNVYIGRESELDQQSFVVWITPAEEPEESPEEGPCPRIRDEIAGAEAMRDAYRDRELLEAAVEAGATASEYEDSVCERAFGEGACERDPSGSTAGAGAVSPMRTECTTCGIVRDQDLDDYRAAGEPDCLYQADEAHEMVHQRSCSDRRQFPNPIMYCNRMADDLPFRAAEEAAAYQAKVDRLKDCLEDNGCG